jgi:vancomycin permeability regulator SanA
MHKDHPPILSKRELLSSIRKGLILTAIAYLALVPFTINLKTTKEMLSVLRGEYSECSLNDTYDVGASLGAGQYRDSEGNYNPTTFGRGRLDTTALLFINGSINNIALLEGFQGQEANFTVGREYIKKGVKSLSENTIQLEDDKIFEESESTSTSTNIDTLDKLMFEKGWNNGIVITDRFHKLRVLIILKIKGIENVCVLTVEEGTEKLNPGGVKELKIRKRTDGMTWRKTMEVIKTMALLYDPDGKKSADFEKFVMNIKGSK